MPAAPGPERLSLCEAVARLRSGELTATRYAEVLLARCAALEKTLHAFAWLDRRHVLSAARAADAAAGARGRLHGVPIGVKDIYATAGIPTGMGSPVFAGHVPEQSAALVARAEREGAYVFGKTVTAELAYFAPGPTRNPWNPAHTPGGSSMGSAAAVAAGLVPLALGTQTNGSVVRPAAYCGCVGFKPGHGLLAGEGIQPFSPTLDQPGFFTRTVEDAALALAALGSLPDSGLWPLASPARAPRLVAVRSPVWAKVEPAARQSLADTVARLRTAGAMVEEAELPPAFGEAHAMHRTIMAAEAAHTLGELQARERARLSTVLNRFLDEGREISPAALTQALAQRRVLQAWLAEFLAGFDAMVTPAAAGEAPATLEHTGDPAFCTIWTLAGVPALTLPVGFGPGRLPLGLQIVGTHQHDAALLAVARWVEQALDLTPVFPEP
jgi:Asp-tRNA(Asn)/Glu-tRNA(Gln) amidotransferase A subunit family amidase